MTFANAWILHFLWLLPVMGVMLIFLARQKEKAMLRFADQELLVRLTGKFQRGRSYLKGLFLLFAVAMIFIAAAGPRWGSHFQEVRQKGVDIMVVVDVSPSMMVEDVKPNRLERARREITDFLRVVQGDRVGLVAFSGSAFVQCPLTLDYRAIEMFLNALQVGLIPVPGTDLGGAVEKSLASFDSSSNTDKVMILITDGEDNEGKGVDAARKAAEKGVKIFVFGIGDTSGGPIPSSEGQGGFKKDRDGRLILSKMDENGLRTIASLTGGTYVRSVAGDLDLDILYFDGIKQRTDPKTLKSGKIKVSEERFMFFILAAFLFLIIEASVYEYRNRRNEGGTG